MDVSITVKSVVAQLASYPGVQKGEGNAWYTLFAHALNLLLDNCIMDVVTSTYGLSFVPYTWLW